MEENKIIIPQPVELLRYFLCLLILTLARPFFSGPKIGPNQEAPSSHRKLFLGPNFGTLSSLIETTKEPQDVCVRE